MHKRILINLMLVILVSVGCAAAQEQQVPRSWITEEATIEDIHNHFYSFCLNLNKRKVYVGGKFHPIKRDCEKGSGNLFKSPLKPGYRVYRFDSPKEYWEGLAGSRGFLLEIDGRIVETITTAVN